MPKYPKHKRIVTPQIGLYYEDLESLVGETISHDRCEVISLEEARQFSRETFYFDDSPRLSEWGLDLATDFEVGDLIVHGVGKTITEDEHMRWTLRLHNEVQLHLSRMDPRVVKTGKPVVYGGYVLSLLAGLSSDDLAMSHGREMMFADCKHRAPVFAGDTVFAESQVLSVQPEPSMDENSQRKLVTFLLRGRKATQADVGKERSELPVIFEGERIVAYRGDKWDPELCLNPLYLWNLGFGLTVRDLSWNVHGAGNLGYPEIEFKDYARGGEMIMAQTEVLAADPGKEPEVSGVVHVLTFVRAYPPPGHPRREKVLLTFRRKILVQRRPEPAGGES